MTNSASEQWAIVGGGILGMTLAHRLAQAGKQVTLLESSPQMGGLASAWTLGDRVWDRHYHVTLLSDLCLRSLLKELRLEADMQWVETKTGCYTDGKLYSVSNAIEFLQFPPLGLIDKIRLGLTILYASRITDWRRLEQISVVDWLKRWSGNHTFQKFWLPLLRAKLGENYKKASAAFIWAIIARLYAARRTGLKKEMFGYLPGGYARLLERFAQTLTEEGVSLWLNAPVRQVRSTGTGRLALETANGQWQTFDQIVLTVAAPIAAQLCPELAESERDRLQAIQYQGIICASLLLKQPLSPYYVTNITDSGVPFTGVIEMTTLVDPQEFGGKNSGLSAQVCHSRRSCLSAHRQRARGAVCQRFGTAVSSLRSQRCADFQGFAGEVRAGNFDLELLSASAADAPVRSRTACDQLGAYSQRHAERERDGAAG